MSELKVFRASAGSGKTYTLTQEYIRLLFNNPTNYAHTLAVTFTNKATAEMRARILSTLHDLSCNAPGAINLKQDLKKEFNKSDKEISTTASELLSMLLHDFSRFSISTIDSFFQKVTRSFAREMGLPAGFRLELETNHIMLQAIDRLILEMDEPQHKEVKEWLIQFARERMENDKGWNIASEISRLSNEIFKETYQANALRLSSRISDKNFLATYKRALEEIIRNVDDKIKAIGNKGLEIISHYNLDLNSDFSGKSRTKVKVFERFVNQQDHLIAEKFIKLLDGADQWTRKDNPTEKNIAIEEAYNSGLHALLTDALEIIEKESRDYHTARFILPELNALGVVNDVNKKMMEICREQNVFLISGTNFLLTQIINENESPFIYEKTGSRYAHYMMDEFQDTSSLQYLNFLPLINDTLASGQYALMVGDVKQAIYRWRNSDWNLLAEAVEEDFKRFGLEARTLHTNWRSNEEVIRFNNSFFKMAARLLQQQFNNLIPEEQSENPNLQKLQNKIENAYHDIEQQVPKSGIDSGGELFIKFIEGKSKDDFMDATLHQTILRVDKLVESGNKLSDICILVRKNDEAVAITNALLSGSFHPNAVTYPVISNESLVIANSEAIRLILAQLRYIRNPEDNVTESFIRMHWLKNQQQPTSPEELNLTPYFHNIQTEALWNRHKATILDYREKPIYQLAEELIRLLPEELCKTHGVYIQSFMSLLLKFIIQESADLNKFLDYWDKSGQRVSLSVPDNQDAIRVMTIHKSKGLEFKTVILPFANWSINGMKHSNLLWLEPPTEPFNAIPLVPVKAQKDLAKSHFAEAYLNEIMHQYVDNLNLAYVALTRARESLNVFCQIQAKENDKPISEYSNISQILHVFAQGKEAFEQFPKCYNEEEMLFHFKKLDLSVRGAEKSQESKENKSTNREFDKITATPFSFTSGQKSIVNHLESEEYFRHSDETGKINYGKIMHRIFEQIVTTKDVDKVLSEMKFKGQLSQEESLQLKKEIEVWLSHPNVASWFDGSYQVKTEAGILAGEIRRPDRVMIKNGEVLVVDYKFGESRSFSHHQQVLQYMKLIRQMGYGNVRGYLWYVSQNEIEEVK